MSDVVIKEVRNNKELKDFVSFPYWLYKNNRYWVPPLQLDEMATLRKDKNPAFDHCEAKYWLAYRDGRVVGRIAGIINQLYIEKWGKRQARYGWIDFINDRHVSEALLNAVETWAKEKGMDAIHGPMGFTDLDYEGMLVDGFNEYGTLATIYNYPYYPVHLENNGYEKDVDWVEYEIKVPDKVPEKVQRMAAIVKRKYNLRIFRAEKSKDVLPYAKAIFDLVNEAYGHLYGAVPLTEKQVNAYVKQYFNFIRPDFISIVLDAKDDVVAFGITMPSLSKALQKSGGRMLPFGFIHIMSALKRNDTGDMYLVAVRPDLQNKGLNALLMNEISKTYIENNIVKAESNPELETNAKVQSIWKYYESRQHKRRRSYIKYFDEVVSSARVKDIKSLDKIENLAICG